MTLVALPIVLLLVCAAFGLMFLSREMRANFWIWQGNERKGARMLEAILDRNPEKLHLYRKLARIYYLENRRDRRALRIFELILRFRVPFEWRDELFPLVAKHYIIEGRKDAEAIKLIERAVDKELKKMQNTAP